MGSVGSTPNRRTSYARVLVASDSESDAESVVERLKQDFSVVRAMVGPDADAALVQSFEPDVIVLAFKSVHQSESFLLGLFRTGGASQAQPCRAILLCSKDEVMLAFELCMKGHFDDYVLYWPIAYDGMRLTMSVHIASREAAYPKRLEAPNTGELVAHVKHLDAVDEQLETKLTREDRAWLEPHMSEVRHLAKKVRQMRLFVLVVEDDPLACEVTEEMLRDQPIDLMFAADGPSAMTVLRRQRPDLILMDIRLPGVDGVTLTRTLKSTPDYADIPVVMLTGSAKKETVAASMSAGAASFLVKPMTRDALIAKIRQYMPAAIKESNHA